MIDNPNSAANAGDQSAQQNAQQQQADQKQQQADGTKTDGQNQQQQGQAEGSFELDGYLGIKASSVEEFFKNLEIDVQKKDKRIADKDAHIKKIEAENRQLRSQYSSGNQNQQNQNQQRQQPQKPKISLDDPDSLTEYLASIEERLTNTVETRLNEQNQKSYFDNAIRSSKHQEEQALSKYGAENMEKIIAKADELAISVFDPYGYGQRLYKEGTLDILAEMMHIAPSGKSTKDYSKIANAFKKQSETGNAQGGSGDATGMNYSAVLAKIKTGTPTKPDYVALKEEIYKNAAEAL